MPEVTQTTETTETANVDALLDSINAIDQSILVQDVERLQHILKANIDHIELQLGKEIYQTALTKAQKTALANALTRGKAAQV